MPVQKLKTYLDENNVKYVSIKHSNAYTSQEIASTAHVSGKEFAKTVIIKIDENMAMAVLPASYEVDFQILNKVFKPHKVALANEAEFKYHFPDCEVGAMPPFGNLYDMEVYVDELISTNKKIAFNAGTHTEIIKMDYEDFEDLVNPRIIKLSRKAVSMPHDPSERWDDIY